MIIDSFMCDYGGVVSDHYSEPFQGQLASALGVTRSRLRELLSERSPQGRSYRLDKMSKREFWEAVRRLAGKGEIDEDYLQELWARTYIPNQSVLSLLRYLNNSLGVQTGIVMNEDRWRYNFVMDHYKLDTLASVVITSFEVGALKPEMPMYHEILRRCSRTNRPERVIYIDDRQSHVDAAISCGMQGYSYINAGELACFVDSINFLAFEP
jgi:FMN phosphatase YigB (HAD superfamily)